jgi:hypothetical protein
MEAQDYVSKIVQIEKMHRAMVTKELVTKYQKRYIVHGGSSPVRHFIAHRKGLYRRPERPLRPLWAASFEPFWEVAKTTLDRLRELR